MQIYCNFLVSHHMTDVNNVDKMQIGVVVLMYKFVMCSYVNLGT